jgi:hypothetical protein
VLLDPTPGQRREEVSLDLVGASVGNPESLDAITPDPAPALGQVGRRRRGRFLDLIGELGPGLLDEWAQETNQLEGDPKAMELHEGFWVRCGVHTQTWRRPRDGRAAARGRHAGCRRSGG